MAPRKQNAQVLESRRTRGTQSYRCRVCRGIHPLKRCQRFLKLSAEKRLRAVLVNKYCANCLAHEHSQGDCRSGDRCRTCDEEHHTLLHITEPSKPSKRGSASQQRSRRQDPPTRRALASPPRSGSSTPEPSTRAARAALTLATLLQHHVVNVLPTALVTLEAGPKIVDTVALIDPCSPQSCIDATLASSLRLPTTNVGKERVCTAILQSKVVEGAVLEVVLKIEPGLGVRTPIRAIDESVVGRYKNLPLADKRFYLPASISMVLGADVYAKVIQPGFHLVAEGLPVAQKTIFGWILSGACNQG